MNERSPLPPAAEPSPVRKNGWLIVRVNNAYTAPEATVHVAAEHADEMDAYRELGFLRRQTPSHAGHVTFHLIAASWS